MASKRIKYFLIVLSLIAPQAIVAADFRLPENPGDSLIGDKMSSGQSHPDEHFYTTAKEEDTLLDIARQFNLGQTEIILANPTVDRWLPKEGTRVRIPNARLLPNAPRKGVVINLPEYRMYYYSGDGSHTVTTHPISIGRLDWKTPLGKTRIATKTRNPTWTPPESIKREHAERGDFLPNVVPAGPDNPLGLYAMRLGVPGYLIHSTNKPFGVGMSVTHGCIRMYPEDIEKLFPRVSVGTDVYIVNQPIKVGWYKNTLYVEIHQTLTDEPAPYKTKLEQALDLIIKANNQELPVINGAALKGALERRDGRPIAIYTRLQDLTASQ
ncbi:MAG: L,D-transpeptidase family protein [Methylicorpusculum sp.]|uniref:L,D-transpeptidase family protein n=1 Tax=Methylicorpusculum sp. TaxID=2713644 RepID=UPI00272F7EB3|nr:L,D-transpeptidase family protein [Methylicorpusculum sp.]MDP2178187.1 L,D-transpeptidase family protein [Methylicorpusculum sp.]